LPNLVVDASSINALKVCLDKMWSHQNVKYDFEANLTGIGNDQNNYSDVILDDTQMWT